MTEKRVVTCPSCGATDVVKTENGVYKCSYCDSQFVCGLNGKDSRYILEQTEAALWNKTCGEIERITYNLEKEVKAEYLRDKEIVYWCRELKKLVPTHFLASFYELAVGNDNRALAEFISRIDAVEYRDEIDDVLRFAVKLLSCETMLAVDNLIIRAYEKSNVNKFGAWSDVLHAEKQKINESVYDVTIERDVFVAYKSEDMRDVEALVDVLENEEYLDCFVAARNLKHGKISDYDKLLKTAMDNCRAVVFVSSCVSRARGDARYKELPYVKRKDMEIAPAEYRASGDYKNIPHKYKKRRVEYVIEPYKDLAAETFVKNFFDGYERVYKPNIKDVARSLMEQFDAPIEMEIESAIAASESGDGKYCKQCGKENAHDAKYCSECGNTEFADTFKECVAEESRKRVEAEYAAKLETEKKERERLESELKRMRESKDNNAQREKDVTIVTKEEIAAWYQKGEECYKQAKYAEAVKWHRKAAELGHARAQCALGWHYRIDGPERDFVKAVSWFRKAAEQGNAMAQYGLGDCYEYGAGVKQNYIKAVKWYRKAAEQGDVDAQCKLGYYYVYNKFISNYSKSAKWYMEAAKQENAEAQFHLGYYYEYGMGVKKNIIEAVKWYRKAAEQGHAAAQCNLGVCYDNGRGVKQDYAEAVSWYRKAAAQGNAAAQYALDRLKAMRIIK